MNKKYLRAVSMLLLVMLTVACGPNQIRDESPMVRISELSHQNDIVSLQLSIRNINDEELDITGIDFSLTSDDQELLAYSGPVSIDINANGTETWLVDIAESDTTKQQLDALQSGEIKSLPYKLKGTVNSLESGRLHFEHQGHLYPSPGRAGHFR